MSAPRGQRDKIVALIAIFKLLKSLLLIAAGIAALQILRPSWSEAIKEWAASISFQTENGAAQRFLAYVSNLTPKRVAGLGLAAFAYGALFAVEGVGLWLGRRWAEYLTVIATGSLVPFEIYEMIRKPTATRITALLLNIAIVAYLIFRLKANDRRSQP